MTEDEVCDFFVEYNLFPRYDAMYNGYDILDSDGCIVATLKDNPTYADCLMTIKDLEASNFYPNVWTRTLSFFKEIIKDPGFQFGFLVGFLTGIGMIIVGAIMAN